MSKGPASQTPVMLQYRSAKAAHPDALLFFRMGDFYELFFEDAVVAARALDLTLTARNKGAADAVPMAGVPHHAASGYVQKLLELGFKVALCEQMADPAKIKGIVPREVVRVVSPGIAFDDAGLDAKQNHYLVSVERDRDGEGGFGIAALDLSTGELLACEAEDGPSAVAELVRLDAREVLISAAARELSGLFLAAQPRAVVRSVSETVNADESDAILDAQLGRKEAQAACSSSVARRAAARCVSTARRSEGGRPLPIPRLVFYALGDTLVLDEATQAHLELVRSSSGEAGGSLLSLLDATQTAPGARLLRRRLLAPLMVVADIRRRQDVVELFVSNPRTRRDLRSALSAVGDLERLAVKFALDRASPRDLTSLRLSLAAAPAAVGALRACPDPLAEAAADVDVCSDLSEDLGRALASDPPPRASDGGVLRDGFDPALDEARELMRGGQRLLVDLEGRLREASGIGSLKLRFTRVFGWYIEVTRSHLDKAPRTWRRKQTIANAERFTCDELDELADKMAHAEERASERETELLAALRSRLARASERLRALSASLAEWDVATALAEVAHREDWARPIVDESLTLTLEDARHPVVERLAAAGRFVPNDVRLDAGNTEHLHAPAGASRTQTARLWLVTGPNMAGKSTLMRQTALVVILAQMGSFVPARRARIGVVDRVLTRVGASDNLSRGESTFMVEMKETAHVLRRATQRSLVVLDEIGRGTSTYDGLAIAWAVAEHLHDAIACRALFATHYHELTDLAETRPGTCENWSVSAREHEGNVVFLHKLQRGAASRSYGVACAKLAGLPEGVLVRAKSILSELEGGAVLPGGGPSSLRVCSRQGRPQLDLFERPCVDLPAPHPAVSFLRDVDVDRMTPLEALQLVATLKQLFNDR